MSLLNPALLSPAADFIVRGDSVTFRWFVGGLDSDIDVVVAAVEAAIL